VPVPEDPYTAEDQVEAILEFFQWTDAVKRSITVMKAVQLWYYGYPAARVCNDNLLTHIRTQRELHAAI
jgi:hypothetical protein